MRRSFRRNPSPMPSSSTAYYFCHTSTGLPTPPPPSYNTPSRSTKLLEQRCQRPLCGISNPSNDHSAILSNKRSASLSTPLSVKTRSSHKTFHDIPVKVESSDQSLATTTISSASSMSRGQIGQSTHRTTSPSAALSQSRQPAEYDIPQKFVEPDQQATQTVDGSSRPLPQSRGRASGVPRYGMKSYSIDQSKLLPETNSHRPRPIGTDGGSRVQRSYSLDRAHDSSAYPPTQYLNGSRSMHSGEYEEAPVYPWKRDMQQPQFSHGFNFSKRDSTGGSGLTGTDTKLAELERSLQEASDRISRASNLNNYLVPVESRHRSPGNNLGVARQPASPIRQPISSRSLHQAKSMPLQSEPKMAAHQDHNIPSGRTVTETEFITLQPIGRGVQDLRLAHQQQQSGAGVANESSRTPANSSSFKRNCLRQTIPAKFKYTTHKRSSSVNDTNHIFPQKNGCNDALVEASASQPDAVTDHTDDYYSTPHPLAKVAYPAKKSVTFSSAVIGWSPDSPVKSDCCEAISQPIYPSSPVIMRNSADTHQVDPRYGIASIGQQQQFQSVADWSTQRSSGNPTDITWRQQHHQQHENRVSSGGMQRNSGSLPSREDGIGLQIQTNGPLESPLHSPASGPSMRVLRSPLSPTESPHFSPSSIYRTSGEADDPDSVGSVNQTTVRFVRDTTKFWYRPAISRDETIAFLKDKPPGSFLVRDSSSFPNHFGLAVRVAQLPEGVQPKSDDLESELVRHFLIEKTAKGVRIRSCANERFFGSLAALIYQHTLTPLALPCRLILPDVPPQTPDLCHPTPDSPTMSRSSRELGSSQNSGMLNEDTAVSKEILQQGAVCKLIYLGSIDIESLTGSTAVARATDLLLGNMSIVKQTEVSFKAAADGITLTDNWRKLFFRRHYQLQTISFCGMDPKDRGWDSPEIRSRGLKKARLFGFIARKQNTPDNTCHLFCECDVGEPAGAVVDFVTRYLLGRRL